MLTKSSCRFPVTAKTTGNEIEVAVIVDPADRFAIIEADIATLRGIAQVIAATGKRQIADACHSAL
jgi:hypothetical protein